MKEKLKSKLLSELGLSKELMSVLTKHGIQNMHDLIMSGNIEKAQEEMSLECLIEVTGLMAELFVALTVAVRVTAPTNLN